MTQGSSIATAPIYNTTITTMAAEELTLKGVTEPRDTDVLCGRGGAALRHPGNQTYRRLVNLNKGLYITCLKTEKLKISRSIVAAIREQRGRFLEKESKSGTWFDIGDKKAIEKTSQALREGQPKLRQKIVEMGGAAAMESQFGHAGLYPERVGLTPASLDQTVMMPPGGPPHQHQHQHQQQNHRATAQSAALRQHDIHAMQPPAPDLRQDMHAELFQRLSLRDLTQGQQQEDSQILQQQRASRLRQSLHQHPSAAYDLGMPADSELSLMSEFSSVGGGGGGGGHATTPNESLLGMDSSSYHRAVGNMTPSGLYSGGQLSDYGNGGGALPHPGDPQSQSGELGTTATGAQQNYRNGSSSHSNNRDKLAGIDRRRVFAKMKYTRPPSVKGMTKMGTSSHHHHPHQQESQQTLGDGMPDIHMVESSLSLYSNLSTMTDGKAGEGKPAGVETAKVVDHSREIVGAVLSSGSRHSIMSGLSRIDDASMDHSIFSDLSKKIGNVSTRSIAMSEISGIDMQEREDEDDSSSHTGFEHVSEGNGATVDEL